MDEGKTETTRPAGPAPFRKPDGETLARRYNNHPPQGDQAQRYTEIRAKLLECGVYCVERTPVSPEQTRALNALDEAMFLFNAAIARNEPRL